MKKSLLLLLLFSIGMQAQNFWTEVSPFPSNPNFDAREISIVDDNIVWVIGFSQNGLSYKWSRSENGGVSWTEGDINLGVPDLSVANIHAVSETTAYVSVFPNSPANQGGVWITQDSGITWTQQTSAAFGSSSFPDFIHFWDSSNGIVVGDPQSGGFEIYITADAGITWNQVPAANIPLALDGEYGYTGLYEIRNNTIWFGTNQGRIFRSADQGLNWIVAQSPISDFGGATGSANFAFRNESEGLMVTQDHMQYRTLDGGDSWTEEIPPGVIRNFDVEFVPQTNNAYFIWGEDAESGLRGSSYSTNGGNGWIDLNDADAQPVDPIEVEFHSGLVGYCIGRYLLEPPFDTKFFRLTDPLFRLLKNNEFEDATTFSVYPNPTNGLVKIAGANIDSIIIYDIAGKEVFSHNYSSLTEISLDVSRFQNGIYIAKIASDPGIKSIVKIVKN